MMDDKFEGAHGSRKSFHEAKIHKLVYAGDITCVHCVTWSNVKIPPILCSGCGGDILVHSLEPSGRDDDGGRLLARIPVFDGYRVHGIASGRMPLDLPGACLAVHGDRMVKVMHAQPGTGGDSESPEGVSIEEVASTGLLSSWVLCIAFVDHRALSERPICDKDSSATIVVGKSDNSIEILCLSPAAGAPLDLGHDDNIGPGIPLSHERGGMRLRQWHLTRIVAVECTSRLLLYSMAIMVKRNPLTPSGEANVGNLEIWVASGTIFNECVIWKAETASKPTIQPLIHPAATDDGDLADRTLLEVTDGNGLSASSCPILQAGPLYRCVGHEGSVFSVSWTSGGTELVSTSDDRSARIWRLPDRAGEDPGVAGISEVAPIPPTVLVPSHTFWGHGARVWDAALFGPLLATAGEDGTTRLWDVRRARAEGGSGGTETRCLAVLQGHRGRGIWRLAMVPASGSVSDASQPPCLLVTAGADASVKLWHLPSWLPLGFPDGPCPTPREGSGRCLELKCDYQIPCNSNTLAANSHHNQWQQQQPDVRSEDFIRCLAMCGSSSLFAATNLGRVYRVELPYQDDGVTASAVGASWNLLHTFSNPGTPLVSLSVIRQLGGIFADSDDLSDNLWTAKEFLVDEILTGQKCGRVAWIRCASERSPPTDALPDGSTSQTQGPPPERNASSSGPACHRITTAVEWQAHEPGVSVLGVYWCASGCQRDSAAGLLSSERESKWLVATVGSSGSVRLWWPQSQLGSPKPPDNMRRDDTSRCLPLHQSGEPTSSSGGGMLFGPSEPLLLLEAQGPSKARITCVDVCLNKGLLICGNQDGCLVLFELPRDLVRWLLLQHQHRPANLEPDPAAASNVLPLLQPHRVVSVSSVLRSTHGSSTVSLIRPLAGYCSGSSHVSAGHDGSLRFLSDSRRDLGLDNGSSLPDMGTSLSLGGTLSLAGSITSITEVFFSESTVGGVAVVCGFQGHDFVAFNMDHNVELMREPCGGWRRPSACSLDVNTGTLVFAYFSEHVLRFRRVLLPPFCTHISSPIKGSEGASRMDSVGGPDAVANPSQGGFPAVRSLNAVQHGREINCILLLRPPPSNPSGAAYLSQSRNVKTPLTPGKESNSFNDASGSRADIELPKAPSSSSSLCCVLTGSEDGTLRMTLSYLIHAARPYAPGPGSGSHAGPGDLIGSSRGAPPSGHPMAVDGAVDGTATLSCFLHSSEVGEHSEGASVRCLASCPLPPTFLRGARDILREHCHLVISAGSKEVLTVWEMAWTPDPTEEEPSVEPYQQASLRSSPKSSSRLPPRTLRHRWLASNTARGQQKSEDEVGGRRVRPPPSMLPNNASAISDYRFMALVILDPSTLPDHVSSGQGHSLGSVQELSVSSVDESRSIPSFEDGVATSSPSSCGIEILVVASASDATVQLHGLNLPGDPPRHQQAVGGQPGAFRSRSELPSWHRLGTLKHSHHPTLSLARLRVNRTANEAGQHDLGSGWLVFGGATDGGVTAWHVTRPCSQETSPLPHPVHTPLCGLSAMHLDDDGERSIPMLLHLQRVHQSGVNGLEASWVDQREGLLALISVGDDQAMVITLLRLLVMPSVPGSSEPAPSDGGISLTVIRSLVRTNAHSSAIKALAMTAPEPSSFFGSVWSASILSTGLDQRVRLWSLEVSCPRDMMQSRVTNVATEMNSTPESPVTVPPLDYRTAMPSADGPAEELGASHHHITLSQLDSTITEVLEPSALCMLPALGAGSRVLHAAVAGRGMGALEIQR